MDRNRARDPRAMVPFGNANQLIESAWPYMVTPSRAWLTRDDLMAMDVYAGQEGWVIQVALPGVALEDVEISAFGDTLTIKGELKRSEPEKATYLIRERSSGSFSRTIQIPGIASSRVSATLENGVLQLLVTRPEEERPQTVKVKSKA